MALAAASSAPVPPCLAQPPRPSLGTAPLMATTMLQQCQRSHLLPTVGTPRRSPTGTQAMTTLTSAPWGQRHKETLGTQLQEGAPAPGRCGPAHGGASVPAQPSACCRNGFNGPRAPVAQCQTRVLVKFFSMAFPCTALFLIKAPKCLEPRSQDQRLSLAWVHRPSLGAMGELGPQACPHGCGHAGRTGKSPGPSPRAFLWPQSCTLSLQGEHRITEL